MTQTQARAFGIFSFLALAISVAAFAATPAAGVAVIGDANISASAIQWQTSGTWERLILTVSGPDNYSLSKEFEAGRAATLRLQELGTKVVADGQYTWELRVVPRVSAETRQQLAAAREVGDDQATARIEAEAGLGRDLVRSGTFTIQGGAFVIGAGEEPASSGGNKIVANTLKPAPLDVVTADDEIIQGSLCVGLDCVVNESFGFDTIRLKENNTRIKFDDTSTSAGFPANDWQLTANDSASGGANKFSIDDTTNNKTPFTITGNAPTNSIFVASSGKVGFRTATPVLDLHITSGDTPAIRQEQTSAGGFTAQTWDIGANEANWFVRDVTGGSRLPFRIRPGAPTSSIDINNAGNVGIGTASPAQRLDVNGVSVFRNSLLVGASGTSGTITFQGSPAAFEIYGQAGSGIALGSNGVLDRFFLDTAGNLGLGGLTAPTNPIEHANGAHLTAGGAWVNASSREYKENICDLDSAAAIETVRELKPVTFTYKRAPNEHHSGFIAEDVPDLVATTDRKSLSPMDIVAVLTKVVQEQQKVIGQLSQRIEQLENDRQKPQK